MQPTGTKCAPTSLIPRPGLLMAAAWMLIVLGWVYGPILREAAKRWAVDPRYSQCFLVPVFAVALLVLRRSRLSDIPDGPTWSGLGLVLTGAILNFLGAYLYFDWVGGISLPVSLAGLCVLLLGWRSLRWSLPSIAFLGFLFPLPYRVEIALSLPLQRLATVASTYALQTLGISAVSEGNIILLENYRIGVVDACNGLGMLMSFFAVSTALVLVVDRPMVQKVIIVLAAIPVAMVANTTRITITGLLHQVAGRRVADVVYHDLAGWLMMPMALAMLAYLLFFLDRIVAPVEDVERPVLAMTT